MGQYTIDELFDFALKTNLEAEKAHAQAEGTDFLEAEARARIVAETLLPVALGPNFTIERQSDVGGIDEEGEPLVEHTIVIRPLGASDFTVCSAYYRPDSVVEEQLGSTGEGWSVIVARPGGDQNHQHDCLLEALRMAGVLKREDE